MKWIAIFWFPFVTGCRMAKFVKEEGVSLENHVIATVTAADPIKCRWDCVDTPLCLSVNVQKPGETGRVTCELNSSSKTADPQDLIPSAGTQYHHMAEVEHCTAEQCIYKDALPDGWFRFGSKLLKLVHGGKTWTGAALSCESIRGELVSINSEDENEFIFHLLDQEKANTADPIGGVWIGLNDVTSEGTFSWRDGSHVTYTKWASNQPDNQNGNHDCVRMMVDKGAWEDQNCQKVLSFVCEKEI